MLNLLSIESNSRQWKTYKANRRNGIELSSLDFITTNPKRPPEHEKLKTSA